MLALLAGCYERVDFEPCELSCADEVCPDGLTCQAGRCVPPGSPAEICGGLPPPLQCPTSYALMGTSYYAVVVDLSRDWKSAEQRCEDDLGLAGPAYTHLAVITDEQELMMLGALVPDHAGAWIGLLDTASEGTFVPVTGEPSAYPPGMGGAAPWGEGEPNDNNSGQDCVVLRRGGTVIDLADEACNTQDTFLSICECDANPPAYVEP